METAAVPITVQNSWHALAGEDGSARGGGRGGGGQRAKRGGGQAGGALPTGGDAIAAFRNARGVTPRGGMMHNGPSTASTDNPDAVQSWNTYQNRSNLQRARKEGGVRTLTVEEAIREIEDKSSAVHNNNLAGRGSLWGQWCRRMEDARLDVDCKYIDDRQGGVEVSFAFVFLRSKAVEDAVASVMRFPLSDDTELAFLLSHCLEGDAILHQKIADGLNSIGDSFRDNNRTVPDEFIQQILAVIRALKVNPSIMRDSGQAIHRIDEQISFQTAKWQEMIREGSAAPDARHRCTAELVRLGVEKHKLLTGSSLAPSSSPVFECDTLADGEQVRVLFEELVSVINAMLEECTTNHASAQRQYEAFQTRIRAAMMGDDVEYQRVLEEDSRLDAEISKLTARRNELQRQIDEVTVELQTHEHKKRQHNATSAKVMSLYNQRTKTFDGEKQNRSRTYEKAAGALDKTTKSKNFLTSLCESATATIAHRQEVGVRARKDANRQVLLYLMQHLESSQDTVQLIQRRFQFCRSKLDSMRSELQEAKDIGLMDLAADLQSAVVKFEGMQLDAKKGLECTRGDLEHVQLVLASVVSEASTGSDPDALAMRQRVVLLVSNLEGALDLVASTVSAPGKASPGSGLSEASPVTAGEASRE